MSRLTCPDIRSSSTLRLSAIALKFPNAIREDRTRICSYALRPGDLLLISSFMYLDSISKGNARAPRALRRTPRRMSLLLHVRARPLASGGPLAVTVGTAVNIRDGGGDPNQFGEMTWNVLDFTSTSKPA